MGSRNYALEYLRILAIVLVVMIHVFGSQGWLVNCAVPIFFFVAGYVSTFSKSLEKPDKFFNSRLIRLIVPYISATLLVVILSYFFGKYNLFPVKEYDYYPLTISKVTEAFLFAKASGQLYFLPTLFVVSIIGYFLKNLKSLEKVALLLSIALANVILWSQGLTSAIAFGLFYYFLGLNLSLLLVKPNAVFNKYASIFGLILVVGSFVVWQRGIVLLDIPLLVLGLYCIAMAIARNLPLKHIEQVSGLVMGIFIFHQPFFTKLGWITLTKIHIYPYHYPWLFLSLILVYSALCTLLLKQFRWTRFIFLGEV